MLLATQHKRTPRLNPSQYGTTGTRFTYPGRMEGWVHLGDLITPRPKIEPAISWSKVRHPNRCTTKTPNSDKDRYVDRQADIHWETERYSRVAVCPWQWVGLVNRCQSFVGREFEGCSHEHQHCTAGAKSRPRHGLAGAPSTNTDRQTDRHAHHWRRHGVWEVCTSPLFENVGLVISPNLHRNSGAGRRRNWERDRISTKKRLKSASKPLETAGNCISANPKSNFFSWERRAPDSAPNSRMYGAREKPPNGPVFCVPHFQTPGSVNAWVLFVCWTLRHDASLSLTDRLSQFNSLISVSLVRDQRVLNCCMEESHIRWQSQLVLFFVLEQLSQ